MQDLVIFSKPSGRRSIIVQIPLDRSKFSRDLGASFVQDPVQLFVLLVTSNLFSLSGRWKFTFAS
jgi:hypothetical protein